MILAVTETPWWIYPLIPLFVIGGMWLMSESFNRNNCIRPPRRKRKNKP